MTGNEDWKRHVLEWRVSGLSAEEFSKDKGFKKARLWAWSSRLLKAERTAVAGEGVQLARVIRRPPDEGTAVTVHLHDARVVVRAGADRATLSAVLEAVDGLRRPARGAIR